MENYFQTLNSINVNGHTEKKNGLTYLSWAWAWGEVKKAFPDATYTIYQNEALGGMPYFTDGKTCMVKTGVTINGIEHIEFLPVMDYKNRSIPADSVTTFDINKAIQRSLTKACARHGLGLYIYAGEDLPENGTPEPAQAKPQPKKPQPPKPYVPQGEAPDYRKLCIRTWTAMGKDPAEIATRFSVDRDTTSDRWQQILAEMEQIKIQEANA
jgi:hypothetical protein